MDNATKLTSGVSSVTVGMLFWCVLSRQAHDIELAVRCMEWSVQCIRQTPALYLLPFLQLAIRVAILWLFSGLAFGIGSAFMVDVVTTNPSPPLVNVLLAIFAGFMVAWTLQFIFANGCFVIMYATEMWFF